MHKRIMLKISGEVLGDRRGEGIDPEALVRIAKEIAKVHQAGIEIAVVVGGGNIWRYRDTTEAGIERVTSDYMGMVATVMNGAALMSALEKLGIACRVTSTLDLPQLSEPYLRRKAVHHLEKKRVVVCAGGTGNPYFTTDTAAALRAVELNCDILLKATKVDGVYDADPEKVKGAKRYDKLGYEEAIRKNLQVMDQAAFSLCRESKLKILVFDMHRKDSILEAAKGKKVGTLIS
jgi:uridylate kinase